MTQFEWTMIGIVFAALLMRIGYEIGKWVGRRER